MQLRRYAFGIVRMQHRKEAFGRFRNGVPAEHFKLARIDEQASGKTLVLPLKSGPT
jgi:hypothetical protein